MPNHAPMLPPMAAIKSSVASGMRHLAFFALYLSTPYTIECDEVDGKEVVGEDVV